MAKKSPNQETGLANRGRLKLLIDTKLILNDKVVTYNYAHLGPIWYHSEPSDIPILQTSFLVGTFFATSYSKIALVCNAFIIIYN